MNSKDIQLNRKRKLNETNDNNEKKSRSETNRRQSAPESSLWVDKHRPKSTKQIIGQQGDKSAVNKLMKWLSNWQQNIDKKPGFGKYGTDDGAGFKAALLSGQPGVGKTTTAHLVCKELGFDFIELNASDARNKKTLDVVVKELLMNTTLASYFGSNKSGVTSRHVVIMDEVDGMSGNEDRGGVAELIQLIKTSKVPIICICNDRSHPKMRSLVNYCFDLRFFRPRVEQIKGAMMSIAYKEGIQIAPNTLHELIVSSNQDIRQVLHNLSLLSTGHKRIDNLLSEQSIKDVKLGPFDAVRKVFSGGEEYARMSFQDKSDLFFSDYSLIPLMNFENYCHVIPQRAKTEVQRLKLAMKSIESMAFGDLIEKQIRSSNNWSLLPLEAAFASVMPGAYMNGRMEGMINFPSFMGKLSTTNKRNRLLQELKMHMNLKVSGSKTALNLDYLEPLRDAIIEPLIANGTGGVPTSIEKLENYCLRREDIESITELTLWNNQKDPMSRVDSKVKAALTRAYNKEGFCLPYSLGTVTKGKKGKSSDTLDEFNDGEEGVDEELTAEDEDDIASDAMIKAKKKTTKKVAESESKANTKTKSKSKKSETKKKPQKELILESDSEPEVIPIKSETKKKTKKALIIESDSEPEVKPTKSVATKQTKSETNNGSKVTPKKSNKESKTKESVPVRQSPRKRAQKDVENGSRSDVEIVEQISPKKTTKNEPKVEPKKTAKESKTKKKNEGKSPSNGETSTEKKSKSKKTPENKKESKIESNSGSKGKQLTLNSFFKKK